VLGEQPCRAGPVLADERPARPAPGGEQLAEPPGVGLVDLPPLAGDLVGNLAPGRDQTADPLVLIAPGQQLTAEFAGQARPRSWPKSCILTRHRDVREEPKGLGSRDLGPLPAPGAAGQRGRQRPVVPGHLRRSATCLDIRPTMRG
jgi:hypothetical protein